MRVVGDKDTWDKRGNNYTQKKNKQKTKREEELSCLSCSVCLWGCRPRGAGGQQRQRPCGAGLSAGSQASPSPGPDQAHGPHPQLIRSHSCVSGTDIGVKRREKKKKKRQKLYFFFLFRSADHCETFPIRLPQLCLAPLSCPAKETACQPAGQGRTCVPRWDAPRVPRWEALSVPIWEMPGVLRWDELCVPIWEVLSAPIWEALSVPIWEMPRVLRWDALCPQTGCTACLWRGRATCPHTGCAICPQTGHAARPLSGHAVCLRMGRAACPQPCVPSRAVPSARCWQLPAGCPQPRPHRRLGAQQRARGQPGGLGRR